MKYDRSFFDREIDRNGTCSVKWDIPQKAVGPDVNPMWVADMDFEGLPEVSQALQERAAHPAFGYTLESDASVEALLSFMKRRHGLELAKEDHVLLPCVITGLRAAVLALTQKEERVIVQPPVYGPFYQSARENLRELAECPLKVDEVGRYTMDLDSVEDACRAGARLMLLCNPHNPVGRCWSRQELVSLLEVLRKYGTALISDEIHEDFVYEKGAFTPILSLVSSEEPVVALTSASKTFNLAGLQQAVAFSKNHALLSQLQDVMDHVGVVSGNIFAMTATEAAYRYGDEWLDGLLVYLKEGEQLFRQILSQKLPQAILSPLEATYLGWINLRSLGFSQEELVTRCRGEGLELNDGTIFGKKAGKGYLRVNYACSHRRVMLAAEQLAAAMEKK